MNIDQLTIAEARQIASLFSSQYPVPSASHPFQVGENYFIRTVTHHFTGKLTAVYPQELVLNDAAWIADDGRLGDTIKTGNFSEVEPYPDGPLVIGRASIIDAIVLPVKLPRSQK